MSYKVPVIIVLVLILVLNVGHLNVIVLVLVRTQNKVDVFVLVLVQDDFISTSMDSSWCWLGLDAGDCIPFGPSVCVRHRRLSDTMVPL